MRKLITVFCLFGAVAMASAQDLNNYKYILIPESYNFLEEVNKYQLNALTKFLFEKHGYNTVMVNAEKPQDLKMNSCLGLTVGLKNNSGLFVTKLLMELKDCYGKVVFTSKEGRSREKEYEVAYQEALRDAFSTFKEIDYKYVPSEVLGKTEAKEEVVVKPESKVEVKPTAPTPSVEETTSKETLATKTEEGADEMPVYQYSGKEYVLKSTEQGFGLYQVDAAEPIAILIKTNNQDSFIYNSLTNQGVAYFDADRNLIVEYFSRQENKKVALKYELRN